ncbi:DgyrCDS14110 [Dimorphilus gyrociliatus]|uniref:DgyrCDS14110 n=1 Tax=Dimorphilus gyrociliatus TaxID=2664684 RepID=A0A7I8WCL6_9ANNE|nr:DgyrCDS14110 [Dimorphilus gyrociliatus]
MASEKQNDNESRIVFLTYTELVDYSNHFANNMENEKDSKRQSSKEPKGKKTDQEYYVPPSRKSEAGSRRNPSCKTDEGSSKSKSTNRSKVSRGRGSKMKKGESPIDIHEVDGRLQTLTFSNSKYSESKESRKSAESKRNNPDREHDRRRTNKNRGGLLSLQKSNKSQNLSESHRRSLERAIRSDPSRVLDDPDLIPASKLKSSYGGNSMESKTLPNFYPLSIKNENVNVEGYTSFEDYMQDILGEDIESSCFFSFWKDDVDTILQYASKESRTQASQAAVKYTKELQNYRSFNPESFRQTWTLRVRQVTCYAFLVACFPNYAYTESIDQFLFLEVFYKKVKEMEKCGARLEHDVLTLTGVYTYRNIITKFKELFKEKLPSSTNLSGLLHRLYISQGDLERYLQTFSNAKDFSHAIKSYEAACSVLKHSGKPHHQLAVISLQKNNELLTMFYYIRALAIRHPFPTVEDKITHMFHSIDGKMAAFRKLWTSQNINLDSPGKLSKLVTLRILYIYSRIYSRTSLETIPTLHSKLISDIKDMLAFQKLNDDHFFTRILVIETYLVSYLMQKKDNQQRVSMVLAEILDILQVLCDFTSKMLEKGPSRESKKDYIVNRHCTPLLTSIKYHFDWIISLPDIWNSPNYQLNLQKFWAALATFFNSIEKVKTTSIKIFQAKSSPDNCKAIIEKSEILDGFSIFVPTPFDDCFVEEKVNDDAAYLVCLINSLKQYSFYFCGLDPPVLTYDAEGCIVPVQVVEPEEDIAEENEESSNVEVIVEEVEEEGFEDLERREIAEENMYDVSQEIRELRARRRETARQIQLQKKLKKETAEFFERERVNDVKLHVQPRILIFDTNCYVHCLNRVKKFIEDEKKRYTIVVPLVIIHELTVLSARGPDNKAAKGAIITLQYLKETIFHKNTRSKYTHVYALTASGSRLDRLDFLHDVSRDEKQNDDTILQCCLHYCSKSDEVTDDKQNGPRHIHRKVILLTEDVNLRLKAKALNIPAEQIAKFLK